MFFANCLRHSRSRFTSIIALVVIAITPVDLKALEPQVWLSEYTEQDSIYGIPAEEEFRTLSKFENEYISKNRMDYVVEEGLELVIFICKANYPIMWTVPEPTQLKSFPHYRVSSITVRLSELTPGLEEPSNKYFKTFLMLRNIQVDFASISFACKASEKDPTWKGFPQSTIHLYAGGSRHVLEHEGENITIPVSVSGRSLTSFVLPCRPSRPDTPVILEEKLVAEGEWNPLSIELTPGLKFDPKVGFTLKRSLWGLDFLGLYRCTVNGSDGRDEDAVLLLNLTSTPTTPNTPKLLEPHLWIAKGKRASVIHKGNMEVECCFGKSSSTSTVVNKATHDYCLDPLQCQILKANMNAMSEKENSGIFQSFIDATNCSRVMSYSTPSFVRCHGENLDFVGGAARIFIPGASYLTNRTAFWLKSIFLNQGPYLEKSLTIVKNISIVDGASLNEKLFISIGHNPGGEMDYANFVGLSMTERDYSKSDLIMSKSTRGRLEVENVVEYNRNFYFENETLLVSCFGLRFFYSAGAQLRINYKNKTSIILEKNFDNKYRYVMFHGKATLNNNSPGGIRTIFGKKVNASLGMDSVECFMPAWNSSKWDKLTYHISVKPSILPQFASDGKEEIVYFCVNETEKEILWKVLPGKPEEQNITLTKDGKRLPLQAYELNSNKSDGSIEIIVKFGLVTYDQHGRYQLVVANVKGQITKTFNVIVTGKPEGYALPITLFAMSVLAVLLVAIGVKHRLQLRQVWKFRRRQGTS